VDVNSIPSITKLCLEIEFLGKGHIRLTVERVTGFSCHFCGFEGEKRDRWKWLITIEGILDFI
jgi:hypothetical protein